MKRKTKTTTDMTRLDWQYVVERFFKPRTSGRKGRGVMKTRALCEIALKRRKKRIDEKRQALWRGVIE